jgi:hypothetical protein
MINAFYRAARDMGLSSRWSLMAKAGLSLGKLAADRQGPYEGPPVSELPRLSSEERALVQAHLDAQVPRAPALTAAVAPTTDLSADSLAPEQEIEAEIQLDLMLTLQAQLLEAVERNNRLIETALAQMGAAPTSPSGLRDSWRELWARIVKQDQIPQEPEHRA